VTRVPQFIKVRNEMTKINLSRLERDIRSLGLP
jgi:hypothetical protein